MIITPLHWKREIKIARHETSGFKYKLTASYTHILTFTVSLHIFCLDSAEKLISVKVIELTVIDYTAPGVKSRWSYLKIS